MKKRAGAFLGILFFPFVLFAQEMNGEDEFAEIENLISIEEENVGAEYHAAGEEKTEIDVGGPTERAGRQIPRCSCNDNRQQTYSPSALFDFATNGKFYFDMQTNGTKRYTPNYHFCIFTR